MATFYYTAFVQDPGTNNDVPIHGFIKADSESAAYDRVLELGWQRFEQIYLTSICVYELEENAEVGLEVEA